LAWLSQLFKGVGTAYCLNVKLEPKTKEKLPVVDRAQRQVVNIGQQPHLRKQVRPSKLIYIRN